MVDAHTGEIIRFVDTNRYGRVHGGAYPGDNHTGEADRPFPFADTGLPAPDQYADAAAAAKRTTGIRSCGDRAGADSE